MTQRGLVLTFNKHPHEVGEREVDESDEETATDRSCDQTLRKKEKEWHDEDEEEKELQENGGCRKRMKRSGKGSIGEGRSCESRRTRRRKRRTKMRGRRRNG